MECVFCKIVSKEIQAQIVYEDEAIVAFKDIHPVAPVHLLIIPTKHIPQLHEVTDPGVFASVMKAVIKLIGDNNLTERGYKVEVNGGGAQIVDHLHFHLVGPVGKPNTH